MFEWARAICYSGYRRNQSPVNATYPSYEEIAEDLQILVNLGFKYIRMYDAVEYARRTCQVIRDKGFDLKLMLGPGLRSEVNNPGCPWLKVTYTPEELAQRAKINDSRVDSLIKIANEYDDVVNAVSIGNENTPSWGENNVPVERLISFADKLKANCKQPVTFNEGAFEWPALTELAGHLDIISVHSYPLWYGNTVEEALDVNKEWYKKIKDIYPDKPVIFSEIGWATDAVDFSQMKEGQPNEENQKKYYDAFWAWADSEKIISYMFEAFDEPWKGGENPREAEKHWGIFDVDRKPKLLLK